MSKTEALQAARDLLADMPIPDGYYSATCEVISKLDAALAQQPAASGEPVAFDAEGFRAFVLRELPDDTIIGKGEWWADHLTKCVQWFVKPAAPQPAPARVPLTEAQVEDLRGNANRGFDIEAEHYFKAFRDAERAHGITTAQGEPK